AKVSETRLHDFECAAVETFKLRLAASEVKRCPFLRSRFGENERPGREVERGKTDSANALALRFPLKAAGDHQMNDHEQIIFEAKDDLLAETPKVNHALSLNFGKRRRYRSQHKRTEQPCAFELCSDYS